MSYRYSRKEEVGEDVTFGFRRWDRVGSVLECDFGRFELGYFGYLLVVTN